MRDQQLPGMKNLHHGISQPLSHHGKPVIVRYWTSHPVPKPGLH